MTLKRFGQYQLLWLLAEGRFEVYEAEDTATAHRMVVKRLPPGYIPPELHDRLQRDMAIAMQLREPHIAPVDDWGEIDGWFYLQMPLIDGTDLQTLVDRDGSLSPTDAVNIVYQIAEALDAAHRAGLVHSGVIPENILVTNDGAAYLLGFGYRAFLGALYATDDSIHTDARPADLVGFSPERLRGAEPTDRADTYALACVLYACLTGVQPYRGRDIGEVIGKILTETPPPPSRSKPDIPRALDEVVARGMAKNPEDRYASSGELAQAARDALKRAGSGGARRQSGWGPPPPCS